MTSDRHPQWRHCQQVADAIDIPAPYTVEALCESLSQQRGRPIRLGPLPPEARPGELCGGWIPLAEVDVILVEEHTSQVHRDQIVLHEIGHMVCAHQDMQPLSDGLVHGLLGGQLSDLKPAAIQGMLARTSYSEPEEHEAELVATMLADRLAALRDTPDLVPTTTLRRIAHAFGGPPPPPDD